MSAKELTSPQELDDAIRDALVAVIWVYDSDGPNVGFGKKFEEVASDKNNSKVQFYKACTYDVKDAITDHGLDIDWVFVFKNAQKVADQREDHNAIEALVRKYA